MYGKYLKLYIWAKCRYANTRLVYTVAYNKKTCLRENREKCL